MFPKAGDADVIRAMFRGSLEGDRLGIQARQVGDEIRYGFPVAVLVAARLA